MHQLKSAATQKFDALKKRPCVDLEHASSETAGSRQKHTYSSLNHGCCSRPTGGPGRTARNKCHLRAGEATGVTLGPGMSNDSLDESASKRPVSA